MGTRIGKYLFEEDLENMNIEKLSVLKEGCDHFIKERHREEIHRELTKLNLLAHTYGFDICVEDADGYPWVLNEVRMNIRDRE
jgi:hypothetical protein